MARFPWNLSKEALYETRLSLVTFELCAGGVTQRLRDCALLAWEMFLWSWPWPWPWP